MVQTTLSVQKHTLRDFLNPRWTIVLAGLAVQLFVLVTALASTSQPQTPDTRLAPVAGNSSVCQVVGVPPYSESWVHGIQEGMQVRIAGSGLPSDCAITTQSIQLEIVGLPAHAISVNVLSPPVDFIK